MRIRDRKNDDCLEMLNSFTRQLICDDQGRRIRGSVNVQVDPYWIGDNDDGKVVGIYDDPEKMVEFIAARDAKPTPGNLSIPIGSCGYDDDLEEDISEEEVGEFRKKNCLYSAEVSELDKIRTDLCDDGSRIDLIKVNFTISPNKILRENTVRNNPDNLELHFENVVNFLELLGFSEAIRLRTYEGYCALFPVDYLNIAEYEGEDRTYIEGKTKSCLTIFEIISDIFSVEDMEIEFCHKPKEQTIPLPSTEYTFRTFPGGLTDRRSMLMSVPGNWQKNAMKQGALRKIARLMEALF